MAGYVAHKGMEEFGGEASRQEKAYHVAFGMVPVASSFLSSTNRKCLKFYSRNFW
jgi:hypothetical protein